VYVDGFPAVLVLGFYALDGGMGFIVAWSTDGHRRVFVSAAQQQFPSKNNTGSLNLRLQGLLDQRRLGKLIPTKLTIGKRLITC
jgi:hypothetical protein